MTTAVSMARRDQDEAVRKLWPQIGTYCERHGLKRTDLLTGIYGIPLDGRKIRRQRDEMLLTRQRVARDAGVHVDTISKLENHDRGCSAAVLDELTRVLQCQPADLFRDDDGALAETG